ncbi:MAG: hypothetical protein HDS70_04940 [Bacteroidales bacterium]|nr:hypothetical protein [Bacteroidales bacterium]MBD5217772.1 hypothetical protein [Bacteroidales bacterium]MBD5221699.1 hypothetical protein [Bacteroidales bacterium]
MKKTQELAAQVSQLFASAKKELLANMEQKGIGAIIWDNATAGFHYIPEIIHRSDDEKKVRVARIMGLYNYKGSLYLIEEDRAPVNINKLYDPDTEVKPTVVTLSEDSAVRTLGDPETVKGYTQQGSLEEWLTIADCYFEALNEE